MRFSIIAALMVSLTAMPEVSATPQAPEIIVENGVAKGLCTCILERDSLTFSKIRPLVDKHKSPSGLRRGYKGYWTLKGDSLFLDSIQVYNGAGSRVKIPLDTIYGQRRTPSGYFADWFSDTLRITSGDIILPGTLGWESRYATEEFITVAHGKLISRRTVHNRKVLPGVSADTVINELGALDFGSLPRFDRKIHIRVRYSAYDAEGNPTDCDTPVIRGTGDKATDDAISAIVKEYILRRKPLPVYLIDNRYYSELRVYPFRK